MTQYIVYTDLDGSLLDHHTYSYEPAESTLAHLHELAIPVIWTTSKTFAELSNFNKELQNTHPMIVENGAGIYIPRGYFHSDILESHNNVYIQEGYVCLSLSEPRSHWLSLLESLKTDFQDCFLTFTDMGIKGIIEATGLTEEKAVLANQRDFSEPFLWQASDDEKHRFIQAAKEAGANILEGGRFFHITGNIDKSHAMNTLNHLYQEQLKQSIETVALGDGYNDLPMILAADHGALIKSPVNHVIINHDNNSIYLTQKCGPEGWVEAINQFIQ